MFALNHKVDFIKYSALLFLSLGLAACGGSGGNGSDTVTRILNDSPINGVSYRCGSKSGITHNGGQFSCKNAPVTFSIGGLILGSINSFNDDKQVFPQDFSAVGRDNFTDIKTIKLARLLQSFDDDGDISEVIEIPSSLAARFNNVMDIDDYSLTEIAQMAGVDLVSEAYAISHLRRTLAGGVGHSDYRIHINLTDATPNDSIATDVMLTIKGAEVFSGGNPLGNTITLDGLFKRTTLHLKNPPEVGQDIKIITRAEGYIDSGASIALSADRASYELNLNLVKDAEGVIAPGVFASDMGIAGMVNNTGIVTEVIELESKESEFKPGVKLTIPVDTLFTDKDGNVVKGVDLKITSFDPYESDAIAAYPGGLNVVAEASGFNIAGEPQVGDREINFKSAGFVAISITDIDGNKVKNFSQDIEIAMQFAIGTKDGEGNVVAIGDEVPIWSYDEDTGKWSYEKVGTVQDLNLTDGLYDVVYNLNHLSYWNLDWHYGERCETSKFYLKNLAGNPYEVRHFAFRYSINSTPAISRRIIEATDSDFISFLNAPANFPGTFEVWTKNESRMLSSVSFANTCSLDNYDLQFAYDETSYEYEAALQKIAELNSRANKSIGVIPVLSDIGFVLDIANILSSLGEQENSDDLSTKITAVILEYSAAFINADGYVGVTFNEYGCDSAQADYINELVDNFYYQGVFNGPLADEMAITVIPYLETAADAYLVFEPTQLAYSAYGLTRFIQCGLDVANHLAALGDESGYLTIILEHIEDVILINVASMESDIRTELANDGEVSFSSAATFAFIIHDALINANQLFASGTFSASGLATLNAADAYLKELRSTGQVADGNCNDFCL